MKSSWISSVFEGPEGRLIALTSLLEKVGVRTSYIICRVQSKMKIQGRLFKNDKEFQGGNSRALSQTRVFLGLESARLPRSQSVKTALVGVDSGELHGGGI